MTMLDIRQLTISLIETPQRRLLFLCVGSMTDKVGTEAAKWGREIIWWKSWYIGIFSIGRTEGWTWSLSCMGGQSSTTDPALKNLLLKIDSKE